MDRREFLKAGVGGTVLLGDAARAAEAIEGALEGSAAEGRLIASSSLPGNASMSPPGPSRAPIPGLKRNL